MKKLFFLLILIFAFSCAKWPQCTTCRKYYEPPIKPVEFQICSDSEREYWSEREYTEDICGVYSKVKVYCYTY